MVERILRVGSFCVNVVVRGGGLVGEDACGRG